MEKTIGVFIGRFQPIHNEHERIILKSYEKYDHLIILIGSSGEPVSTRNPFTFEERQEMILKILPPGNHNKVTILPLPDSHYNFNFWLSNVQNLIASVVYKEEFIGTKRKIYMIGSYKDNGSYWLNHFPQYEFDSYKNKFTLNSTEIRKRFFSNSSDEDWKEDVPNMIINWLYNWKKNNSNKWNDITKEFEFLNLYKETWANSPYPPVFITADCLVICKGHLLLIKRGRFPNKGKYALPGGHLEANETIENSAIRELIEETKININKTILRNSIKQVKVIDAPLRDPRGRYITHVHVIDLYLKELPSIEAADDANEAVWMPIFEIDRHDIEFAFDHYHIIKSIL